MTKYFWGILVITALLSAAPRISFQELEYDFGDIERGEKVTHYFVFKNTGDEPLEIKRVRATCGCTATRVTKKILQPGEEGKIKVVFNSHGYGGRITKRVLVESNDPENPRIMLVITGNVLVPFHVIPRFVSFGMVRPESTATETVRIYFEKKKIRVDTLAAIGDFFKVKGLGQKDTVYTMLVSLKKDKGGEGNKNGRVDVYLEGAADKLLRIPVTCKVVGEIELVPSMVSMGGIRGKVRKSQLKILYDPKKLNGIEVDSIKVDVPYLTAWVDSVEKKDGEVVLKLKFKIAEDAPTGMVQTNMHLYTNYPKKPVIDAKVIGFIR